MPPKQSTLSLGAFGGTKKPSSTRIVTSKKVILPAKPIVANVAAVPAATNKGKKSESIFGDSDDDEIEQFDDDEEEYSNSEQEPASSATSVQAKEQQPQSDVDEILSTDDERLFTVLKAKLAISKAGTTAAALKQVKLQKEFAQNRVAAGDVHTGFHQKDLSEIEKILCQFDLAQKYGPCTDLTRLERWERAASLGLYPPQEVKDSLLSTPSLNTPLFAGRV